MVRTMGEIRSDLRLHGSVTIFLALLLIAISSSQVFAQFGDYFGFGKNKVHYKSLDWSVLKSKHTGSFYSAPVLPASQTNSKWNPTMR